MFKSAEHEIINAHKYENIKKFSFFSGSDNLIMLFFLLINVEMPTIVGILTFMSRKKFILSRVQHGKSFLTSEPGLLGVFMFYLQLLPGAVPMFGKGPNPLVAALGKKKVDSDEVFHSLLK